MYIFAIVFPPLFISFIFKKKYHFRLLTLTEGSICALRLYKAIVHLPKATSQSKGLTMVDFTILWKAPKVNPVNRKARSIPGFNPIDLYGRVFFFSWFGFFVAFWSW